MIKKWEFDFVSHSKLFFIYYYRIFKMASINELKEVLKETLEEKGVMSQIRARIRAEIFGALNDSPPSRPDLSNENLIINELIREYLRFNGYEHTLGVFLP